MKSGWRLACAVATALLFLSMIRQPAAAELYINEIFNDPGGAGDDNRDEYIELRGTPGMSLANTYLIFVENEVNLTGGGGAGLIENIFTLGDNPNTPTVETPFTIGSNGYLTLRQKDTLYAAPTAGTTDLVNTGSGVGWGSDDSSSVRHSGEAGKTRIENSGFTAMLIRNNGDPVLGQPFLGLDLDVGNNGLDPPESDQFNWHDNWTIIDSIGIHGEIDEANGRLYGFVNFGQEPTANIEPGAEYWGGGYEIEMVSRWGNSTGHSLADWHATNLTDNPLSGSLGVDPGPPPVIDYRQSGLLHDGLGDFVETNQFVPYGAELTTTLGAANYPLNLSSLPWDYNDDGEVNSADYTIWRDTFGSTVDLRADGNGSGEIDEDDYIFWKNRFGYAVGFVPGQSAGGTAGLAPTAVPEPTTVVLVVLGAAIVFLGRRR